MRLVLARPAPQTIGVWAAGLITFLNLYTPQAMLPTLAHAFAVPAAQTGLTITACLLAVALVAPFVGALSDRLGRKWLITGAAWLLVVPGLLCAGAGTLHALILWRFLQGLMLPFIFTITIAYISEESPGAEAIKLTGGYAMASIIGGFAGRFLAGGITSLLGWRAAFALIALLSLACAAALARFLPCETRFVPTGSLQGAFAGYLRHLRDRRMVGTFAMGFAVLFSNVAAYTFINLRLSAAPFGLGPAGLGAIFAAYLVGLFCTPLSSRLAVRFGRRRSIGAWPALVVLGLACTLSDQLWLVVLGLGLVSGGVFPEQALSTGYVASIARGAKSTAVGLYVTSYYVGGALGGVLPALQWHWGGWPGCVAMVVVVQAAMLALALAFWQDDPLPARQ